jgi:hypothetical protein
MPTLTLTSDAPAHTKIQQKLLNGRRRTVIVEIKKKKSAHSEKVTHKPPKDQRLRSPASKSANRERSNSYRKPQKTSMPRAAEPIATAPLIARALAAHRHLVTAIETLTDQLLGYDSALFSPKIAGDKLELLKTVKSSSLSAIAKAKYKFVFNALAAIAENKQLHNLRTPEGSPFRWPTEVELERNAKAKAQAMHAASREVYILSVALLKGQAIPKSEALSKLTWLGKIDPSTWKAIEKTHYKFVTRILEAIRDGEQPTDITQPDGDSFKWPTTQVGNDLGGNLPDLIRELGVLKAEGYQVGKKAKSPQVRCALLSSIYRKHLNLPLEQEYLDEWGTPGSRNRLYKLANTLSALARNMKRKEYPSDPAIFHWEADLAYLKKMHYDGIYDFSWPATV